MLICYWTKWSDDVANGGAYYIVLQWVVGDLVQQLIVKCVILGVFEEKTAFILDFRLRRPSLSDGLTQWCCDGVAPHTDDFLGTDQFAGARRRQVQGHRLADEGKVSVLRPADALLQAGHEALLALHVLVDAAVSGVVGVLERPTGSRRKKKTFDCFKWGKVVL